MLRRDFFAGTAAAAALASLSVSAYATANAKPRRTALIGPGWYGKCDLLQLLNVEPVEVVALADVDSKMLDEAANLFQSRQPSGKRPQTYKDYRDLLSKHELDIVLVDTPDHWHALPMIAAVEAGADVYCQKPTAVDVLESKAMLDAARKHKRVVQIGTQRRSTPHLMDAKRKVIDAGLLGDVAYAEVCCYYHMRNRKTLAEAPDKEPPANLDWDMWLGPAPKKPYNDIVHPRGWRAFMDYGNGIVGDMCVHMLDTVRWMLDLGWPESVASSGGILMDKAARADITDTQTATYHFKNMDVVWTHRSWGTSPDPDYPWAAFIYGSKGTLKLSVNRYDFVPQGRGEKLHGDAVIELDKYPKDADDQKQWALELHVASAIREHMRNFLKAIDERSKPIADIEQGHISSASCILANLSQKLGRSLTWDASKHVVTEDEEATKLLSRPYRAPYVHPAS
ncbi:MAG: Gfo/Idh/MocA family oxidoreductase [Pirellulales bacterium]